MIFGTQLAFLEPRRDFHGSLTPVSSRSANRSVCFLFSSKDQIPTDFAGYFVDTTRKSLLAATTSLTRLSFNVHDFFLRINQILAFESFVRSSWNCFSAVTTPWTYGANLFWTGEPSGKKTIMPFWKSSVPASSIFQTPQAFVAEQYYPQAFWQQPALFAVASTSMALLMFASMLMQPRHHLSYS